MFLLEFLFYLFCAIYPVSIFMLLIMDYVANNCGKGSCNSCIRWYCKKYISKKDRENKLLRLRK